MNSKACQLMVIFLGLAPIASAQELEHYLPVGFINPSLKSGQYIFSTFYNQSDYKSEQAGNNFARERYNFTTVGYLGLTDKITLSTSLNLFPRQTIAQYLGNSTGQDREKFSLETEIALSYRLRSNFEFFATAFYASKETNFGARTFLERVPVGIDPNTGEIIYEPREIQQPALPDLQSTNANIKVGMTFFGSLW